MLNYFYKDSISAFLKKAPSTILGEIAHSDNFDTRNTQSKAWEIQISILKETLKGFEGELFFEFSIPRMGSRVDVLLIIQDVIFVIEFKVGESKYLSYDIDQAWDYALDLKNFHEPSHQAVLVPILVATEAKNSFLDITTTSHNDNLINPIKANKSELRKSIELTLDFLSENEVIDGEKYSAGRYAPTPTIVEAALSLYNTHSVDEITRSDASAKNLSETTDVITKLIDEARKQRKKKICFVTGVPGAGKTLVGLNVATEHLDHKNGDASVYLSGNGPLVNILQEALARDRVKRERAKGNKLTKKRARSSVKTFIQNIHHYRDEYIRDPKPPVDHVAIFDEAQRAWTKKQTVSFMKRRKGIDDFDSSEPEFLVSCLDRHDDWAVIICLVGGGQEINTGEAGISEWLRAIKNRFTDWEVYISPNLTDSEYDAVESIQQLSEITKVHLNKDLHLSVSLRSYRAENLSAFIKHLLDLNVEKAQKALESIPVDYPIVLTRDLKAAKKWLKEKARGSERYGLIVSSQAERLKPYAVDVKSPMNPIHWFLNGKDDVRSSYYLEQVATEFHIQGLELDWTCLIWDGDLRYSKNGWDFNSFRGSKWQNILKKERQDYLVNAYRVLLTRARQGMIIVVPEGDSEDHTRKSDFYDPTFEYLKSLNIKTI
ncbi:MAG: DUF2075 domain-containing protein [Gracilimonas sp.]|uniref:DUF2075 domain-containing protein n=1 Tax=Gracilimonas TaxID=649462 RepID=UPI001B013D05|nr:DUF2075 domain-containing protein [Gracilimonas sp.]MBO6585185.1 DUF2075 domain-containing protein [Gracilimonas sp.]MBO6615543.1 DUF2075 domain-containing protein [Gracilimonas sp.]